MGGDADSIERRRRRSNKSDRRCLDREHERKERRGEKGEKKREKKGKKNKILWLADTCTKKLLSDRLQKA